MKRESSYILNLNNLIKSGEKPDQNGYKLNQLNFEIRKTHSAGTLAEKDNQMCFIEDYYIPEKWFPIPNSSASYIDIKITYIIYVNHLIIQLRFMNVGQLKIINIHLHLHVK